MPEMSGDDESPEILITAPLTKWLEVEFNDAASIFPSAMLFADADNDGMSEFIAGSIQGDLFIFKGLSPRFWKKASSLGMITVVGAGDVMQKRRNVIYVVTGEGTLYTFMLSSAHIAQMHRDEVEQAKGRDAGVRTRSIEPFYSQKIPPNISTSVLADIDGDGYPEILFGMTDRVVRSFKWVEGQVGSSGAFIPLNKWEFAGQIGNLSASLSGGVAQIFVSQPGCSCIRLKALPAVQHQHPVLEINFEAPMYYSPAASRLRNAMMQAHVLAFDGRESGNIYAVCGFDGGVMVCRDNAVLWDLQTAEHLIAIHHLPLRSEFVLAASSGAVYICNDQKKMIKLMAPEAINGFTCGVYGVIGRNGEHHNTCSFATTGGAGRLIIYYDLEIPSLSNLPSFWRRKRHTEE